MTRSTQVATFAIVILMLIPLAASAGDGEHHSMHWIQLRNGESPQGEESLPFLIERGQLASGGYLGVVLQNMPDQLRGYFGAPPEKGLLVGSVEKDSPADKAGLRAGDVLLSIDGQPADSSRSVGWVIRSRKQGEQVRLEILRSGVSQTLFATLTERKRPETRFLFPHNDKDFEGRILRVRPEGLDKLQEYLQSPEWREQVERSRNCDELRTRVRELEQRLKDLEKQLGKR